MQNENPDLRTKYQTLPDCMSASYCTKPTQVSSIHQPGLFIGSEWPIHCMSSSLLNHLGHTLVYSESLLFKHSISGVLYFYEKPTLSVLHMSTELMS